MENYSQLETYLNTNLEKLDRIRVSRTINTDSNGFIDQLKTTTHELSDQTTDQIFLEHLREIVNFKSYDELWSIPRWWRKLAYLRFQPNYVKSWNEQGKYLSDLDRIEIMLRGLKYKIEKRK